jgi:hypothetical protein
MLQPAPVQTAYQQYINAGQVGMIASTTGWDIDTCIAEDPAGTGIGFARVVSQGTLHGDRSAGVGQLSGTNFRGISCADPTLSTLTFTDKYADGDNMAVLQRGDLWVDIENSVVAGADVYYNNTTGQLGGTSGGHTKIAGARWMTSATFTSGTVLAVVRLTQAPPGP